MITAQEALTRAIADNDAFAVAEWHALLGIANWMTGDVEEAQRLTEIGLVLAEKIGADNLIMRNAFLRGVPLLTPGSDPAVALEHFQRAVRLGERVGGNALYGGAAWAMLLSNCGADNMSAAELAHELATNLPTPMFLVDANGTLVFYNDAAGVHLRESIRGGRTDAVGEWATHLHSPRDRGCASRWTSSRWRSRCYSGGPHTAACGYRSSTVCAVSSRSRPSHCKGNGASTSARRRSSGKRSERHGSEPQTHQFGGSVGITSHAQLPEAGRAIGPLCSRPLFRGGDLWLSMGSGTRKAADLGRDGRILVFPKIVEMLGQIQEQHRSRCLVAVRQHVLEPRSARRSARLDTELLGHAGDASGSPATGARASSGAGGDDHVAAGRPARGA